MIKAGMLLVMVVCGITAGQADAPALAGAPPDATDSNDTHPALPPGPGRDLVVRTCAQCHAVEIVTQQHLGLDGWKKLVDLMASNGAVATDPEFDQITAYLANAFPPLPNDAGAAR
jgi:mono/diheme cytochrome c family protein